MMLDFPHPLSSSERVAIILDGSSLSRPHLAALPASREPQFAARFPLFLRRKPRVPISRALTPHCSVILENPYSTPSQRWESPLPPGARGQPSASVFGGLPVMRRGLLLRTVLTLRHPATPTCQPLALSPATQSWPGHPCAESCPVYVCILDPAHPC